MASIELPEVDLLILRYNHIMKEMHAYDEYLLKEGKITFTGAEALIDILRRRKSDIWAQVLVDQYDKFHDLLSSNWTKRNEFIEKIR